MSTTAVVTEPTQAAPVHVSFWKRLEAKAEELFHMLPKWDVVASDALKVAAPITEEILDVEDPALEAVIAPIITTIQTKLATAGVLIDGLEKSTSLTSALSDVQGNITTILGLAEVKNSTSAAKIIAQLNLLSSVVASIEGAVGTPTAPGVTSPTASAIAA
jgi:hypothetical protein